MAAQSSELPLLRKVPSINFIMALDEHNGFGHRGALPWPLLYEDMAHFKAVTSGGIRPYASAELKNVVVMGKNTWLSIPAAHRALVGRKTAVISSTLQAELKEEDPQPDFIFENVNEAVTLFDRCIYINDIYVIGGPGIFTACMANKSEWAHRFGSFYLTRISSAFPADTYYDPTPLFNFFSVCVTAKTLKHNSGHGFWYTIREYIHVRSDFPSGPDAHQEYQYLQLVSRIIHDGALRPDRTGVGTHSVFGAQMRFDLSDGTIPLLTTKRTFWRGIAEELLWIISGSTDATVLSQKGVKFWDANGSRANLDKLGLTHLREGDLGPVYGHQMRHFGAHYVNCETDYSGQGVDQLSELIEGLKKDPFGRRHIISMWNPVDLKNVVLPPCHMFCQFYVAKGRLSCTMYQRSGDMGLGVPFNIASYSLLTRMIAQVCGYEPGEFIHMLGDAHVYLNHVQPLALQLVRTPLPFPILRLDPTIANIDDFNISHFSVMGYQHCGVINMEMAL